MTAGLVKEVKAKAGDGGLAARRRDRAGIRPQADGCGRQGDRRRRRLGAERSEERGEPAERAPASLPARRLSLSAPRDGTKLALAVGLIRRDHGATLAELVAATGWLAHTTRAALTGLRKRGYAVTIDRSDKERGSIYRIGVEQGAGERRGYGSVRRAASGARRSAEAEEGERAAASPARQAA